MKIHSKIRVNKMKMLKIMTALMLKSIMAMTKMMIMMMTMNLLESSFYGKGEDLEPYYVIELLKHSSFNGNTHVLSKYAHMYRKQICSLVRLQSFSFGTRI